ncbi:MAG: M23 family metallopeptidase [Kofleriaceae bacterium]|nr:MAG: M23 family metallopeptidase [Kofleriaceae bacterium]
MSADHHFPLALGAAGVGAALVWLGGSSRVSEPAPSTARASSGATVAPLVQLPPPSSWVFPVPSLGDRVPQVSDGWASPRHDADGTRRLHLGADIMFRRRHRSDLIEVFRPGTPHGTRGYFMPDHVPALAARAGRVTFAKRTPQGFTVQVHHAEGWTTYYTHLSRLLVAVGDRVAAGQPLGIIGGSPLDRRRLMHLHFELWRGTARSGATNPEPYLRAWRHVGLESGSQLRNRGSALTYRPVGARGERYPEWVQALRGESGVYVIRERDPDGTPIVVYVGESHSGRLYETLTRHFQTWRRWKGFWKGQFAEGHDPGLTYPRDRVDVAVRVLPADAAIDEEERLIRRLRPRDNLIGQPEDVPF